MDKQNSYNTNVNKMDDGVYIEVFAMKDNIRYNMKIVKLQDVSTILTNSLMDGIEKVCE